VNDHTHIGVTSLQRIRNPRQHLSSSGRIAVKIVFKGKTDI